MAGRRTKTPEPPVVIPTNALVASAVRYPGTVARIFNPARPWQEEAYRHYAICGEARFAANFFGHSLSRAEMYVAERVDNVKQRAETSEEQDLLNELFGGPDGQPEMLTAAGIHLTVAGEFYLVGRQATGSLERDRGVEAGQDLWEVVSCLEMKRNGNKWSIEYQDGGVPLELTDSDTVIRVWRPDPARRIEADSPFRSLLPVLSEIEHLTLHIFSQVRSRLLGAGILFMPQEMEFPPPPSAAGNADHDATNQAQNFMAVLAEGMLEANSNDGSPANAIPLVVTTNAEQIEKARLMTFWSELDAKALEMRSAAVNRFALGMDGEPEQFLGSSSNSGTGGGKSNGQNHWSEWAMDEKNIKLHIEPMLRVIGNAVTIAYLRPLVPDSVRFIDFDTQSLRLRPDRSEESITLWDRGVLKTEVMLRENGFSKDDMPDADEQKQWLIWKFASAAAVTPAQVAYAAQQMGVALPDDIGAEPAELRPPPSIKELPSRDLPDRSESEAAAVDQETLVRALADAKSSNLIATCDALMFRGLERIGNRLRQDVGAPPNCRAWETHTLIKANGSTKKVMQDAFGAAEVLLPENHETIVPILEAYTETLLNEQSPHDKARLVTWLGLAGVA